MKRNGHTVEDSHVVQVLSHPLPPSLSLPLTLPSPSLSLQAKLPEGFKLDVIRKKLGEVVSPTSVVLLQELERFNKLIKRMAVSLNSLQKVLPHPHSHTFIYCHICMLHAFVQISILYFRVSLSPSNGVSCLPIQTCGKYTTVYNACVVKSTRCHPIRVPGGALL